MITIEDSIRIKFIPELTQTSLAFVLRSIPNINFPEKEKNALYSYLQLQTLHTVAELAFQRYLLNNNIPFEKILVTPLSQPDRFNMHLGGCMTFIHAQLISSLQTIHNINQNPALLLNQQLSIYNPQQSGEIFLDRIFHVFCFILVRYSRSRIDTSRAIRAGQPIYWLYLLPERMRKPTFGKSLKPVSIQSNAKKPIKLEIGGQTREKEFIVELLEISPNQSIVLKENFFIITYLHPSNLPDGKIHVRLDGDHQPLIVTPEQWKNIWVYGSDIYFMGYLTNAHLKRLKPRSKSVYYKTIFYDTVTCKQLKPLKGLFQQLITPSDSMAGYQI